MNLLIRAATITTIAIVAAGLCGCGKKPTLVELRGDERVAPKPAIRVATWNIRIGFGPDEWPAGGDPRGNLSRIAARVRESGADIVLLQEVDRGSERSLRVDELELLREATGLNSAWGPAIESDTMQYGVALLSRWPIESARTVALPRIDYRSSNPDLPEWYSESRVALVAHLDHPLRPITVINTHLGLTREQRILQVEVLARLAGEERAAGRAVIVGGDLNAEPDARELIPLRAALTDAYQGHRDERGMEHDIPIRDRLTYPALTPERCIDYLFYSTGDFAVHSVTVPSVPLSDHLPVEARFALRN